MPYGFSSLCSPASLCCSSCRCNTGMAALWCRDDVVSHQDMWLCN
ncbi:hypothetical protein HMPREF1608_03046 [Escherichia coli 908525]|nr:hypothetical protein HMPREF1608_03046 [Escherichia coli 908525]